MLCRLLQLAAVLAVAFAPALRATVLRDASSVEDARVIAVKSVPSADLVLIGAGFDAGFRQGMVCSVSRGSAKVAEILLVGLRPHAGAALILDLASGQSIRPGDLVTVNTLNS